MLDIRALVKQNDNFLGDGCCVSLLREVALLQLLNQNFQLLEEALCFANAVQLGLVPLRHFFFIFVNFYQNVTFPFYLIVLLLNLLIQFVDLGVYFHQSRILVFK